MKQRFHSSKKIIRLGCDSCFRDDGDGITRAQLEAAIRGGWRDVRRVQTYAQSIRVYDDPSEAPPGYSVFDWETHKGLCPDCAADEAKVNDRITRKSIQAAIRLQQGEDEQP